MASATIVLSTVAGSEMLADEPTARNSNLLPVKAKGEVRFRSPEWRGRSGSTFTPSPSRPSRSLSFARPGLFQLVEDVLQLAAQEHRDDRGRRLVGAQAVVVAGSRHAGQEQILVLLHRAHHRRAEEEEHQVVVRRVAGIHQVSVRGSERPVDVLAAPVDSHEGLLVQEAHEAVAARVPFQHAHRQLLVVRRHVRVLVDRRHLVLSRRHLVVARLHRHAQAVQVHLDGLDVGQHSLVHRAEVVIVEFLPPRRLGAEEGASGGHQVGTAVVELAVDEEELLLGPEAGRHAARLFAEKLQCPARDAIERVYRLQQRDLRVEALAGPAGECCRDAEVGCRLAAEDERRRGRIPGRVAAGLEGGPQTPRREGRRVRLALYEFVAAEIGDGPAVPPDLEERIVLLGRAPGQRLEPVRVVRRAPRQRPVLHRRGYGIRNSGIELLPVRDRPHQLLEDVLGQPGLHLVHPEGVLPEDAGEGSPVA